MIWNLFFKKRKPYIPYTPQGKVGYVRKHYNGYQPYAFTIIVEEIGRVGNSTKIRVLEVDVDRDCEKSKKWCLEKWGCGDWVASSSVIWETDSQKAERLNRPVTYQVPENELQHDVLYRHEERQLTRHNFIQN